MLPDFWSNLETARSIDVMLRENWLLDFQPDLDLISTKYPDTENLVSRFDETKAKAASRTGPNGVIDERELFRLLAHPGLFSLAAAARRHYILDGVALAIGVLRRFELAGPVLDVGCHIGASTIILGELTTNRIMGLDPVGPAIETAKKLSRGLTNVEFVRDMLPWSSSTKFDLVLCQDVLHHIPLTSHPRVIASLGELVTDGGFVLLSCADMTDRDWLHRNVPALQKAHLGFVDCDVLGGFGGVPPSFLATAVVLLRKGDDAPIPLDLASVSVREWEAHFKQYANDPKTPVREKTQAFERATRAELTGD
jgi:2-polyprenyl-3-methyl-5-hydroxy-6-metoxy-1,4-benzoquinol methylase